MILVRLARLRRLLGAGLLGLLAGLVWGAPVSVRDDDGRTISLPAPARRIVSLAPHTTALLFDAGAGAQVVATVRFGDHPAAAKSLPVVGDAHQLDLERIAALKPDLLVVWMHGVAAAQIERLQALKLPIFHSEPRRLAAIGDNLRRLGHLAGTDAVASRAADDFDRALAALRQAQTGKPRLRAFYQVWNPPLLTLNDQHLISDVMRLCGGDNVFGGQATLVPAVSVEAVLAAHPQVLVASTLNGEVDDSLTLWQSFKGFEPVARQAIVILPADLISQPTPRILQGAARLCEGFDRVRQRSGLPASRP